MSAEQFDVVVIGGGPGGSTAGALIAKQGHRVLLLEREKFPRYQIGESLLPSTVHGVCDLLGVREEVINAGFTYKRGACMRWGKRPEPWVFEFSKSAVLQGAGADYAFQVERSKFDDILLRNAKRSGVDVREEHQVTEILSEGDRVTGLRFQHRDGGELREARAKYVVDASGAMTKFYTQVGKREFSEFFKNSALFCYFEGAKRMAPPLQGNILCAAFDEGWFWFIPLTPDLTSVGVVINSQKARGMLTGGEEEAIFRYVERCPIIKDMLAPAKRVTEGQYGQIRVRRDWSYINDKFWKPGMATIGDAACFIDPVLSTGVHFTTYAGLMVARSINTVLAGSLDEKSCFDEFERRYRDEYKSFYDFLVSFYDMHVDEESYFWSARKVIHTEERSNEAFIRLVGGGLHAEDFFGARLSLGATLDASVGADDHLAIPDFAKALKNATGQVQGISMAELARKGIDARPRYEDGLISSADGLHWVRPAAAST